MMKRTLIASFAGLALAAGAAYAFAQGAPSRYPTPAPWAQRNAMMQQGLARLKAQLQITASQENAWNGFASALQGMHAGKPPMRPASSATAGLTPAPQVFSKLAQHAQTMADNARKLSNAAASLYKVLTPVQRAVLDTHIADTHAMFRHWRGKHGEPRVRHEPPMMGASAPPAPPAPQGGGGQ